MTKPSIELSDSLFSTGSGINTAFPLGAKGETGSENLQKPPHPPLILRPNQAETNSHKNLVKSLTSAGGGRYTGHRKMMYARNYLLDFGPVGAKDDHSQIPFEWVGWSSYCLVAIVPL